LWRGRRSNTTRCSRSPLMRARRKSHSAGMRRNRRRCGNRHHSNVHRNNGHRSNVHRSNGHRSNGRTRSRNHQRR
jgi:hypothetical protein